MKHGVYKLMLIALLMTACGRGATRTPAAPRLVASEPALKSTATLTPSPSPVPPQTSEQDGMVMLYVPAGEFMMGSPDQEDEQTASELYMDAFWEAEDDEKPQHAVSLDAFWIDQTEVTNAMFAAFLNAMGNQKEGGVLWLDARAPRALIRQQAGRWQPVNGYQDHPVVEVTWYGARAYCEWAGRRLPTEAKWEKAARGTDGRKYPWGNEPPTCELANFDGRCFLRATTQVGSYPTGKSPYGVLDMAGNVWEWVADWYTPDYYAHSPRDNPQGPESGESRVIRGASWHPHQYDVHAAKRAKYYPHSTGPDVGFRCVRDAQP